MPAVAVAAALALGTAAPAFAAPPANDNFADAIELTTPDGGSATGTTVDATVEPGEQGTGTRSIWYRVAAPSTNAFGVDACDAYPHHTVSVWTGTTLGALTARYAGGCSVIVKPSSAGQVFHIRVRPEYSTPGRVTVKLRPRPENDDFPGTTLAGTATRSSAVDPFAATRQEGEPGDLTWSVWWSWQPGAGSVAVADVCTGISYRDSAARVEAYEGDALATLVPGADEAHHACRGEYSWRPTGTAVVRWTPGLGPARLVAGGRDNGLLAMRVRSGSPPAGDAFAAPRALAGSDLHEYYRTTFATSEAGEPATDGTRLGAATVWFRWTPPGAGTAILDSCDGAESRIHAYRGTDLTALELLSAANTCRQRVPVGDGESLALQAGVGRLVEADYLDAKWGPAPANDLFANAEVLAPYSPTTSGDVAWATRTDEPQSEQRGATVWYQWTASATGIHVVDTCGSPGKVEVRVSTGWGPAVQVVNGVGSGTPFHCRWHFDAVKGRGYRIRVLADPAPGASGAFDLELERLRGDGVRDFNGDSVDDLAIGIPDRAVGGHAAAGAVEIAYGRAGGAPLVSRAFTQDSFGVADAAEPGDRFGAELAVADFDGDGFDDLAVGSPSESIGAVAGAGAVHILYGSLEGLRDGSQVLHKASAGVPGNPSVGDAFGTALDGAPLDDNAGAELLIGAPGERSAAGAAYLMRSGFHGVDPSATVRLSEDAGTTPGVGAAGERFGSAVAVGEDDLVVGVPNEDIGGEVDAGAVYLLPEEAPTGSGGRVVTQNKAYVPDTAEAGDHFGAAVATGQLTSVADGGDVIIGAPEENGVGTVTALLNAERTPRTEPIRSSYEIAGGRFGSALDVAYGYAAIGGPGERVSGAPSRSGVAQRAWIPRSGAGVGLGARGFSADANLGADVTLLQTRPGGGGTETWAGTPNLDVGGFADAGGAMTGQYSVMTTASPTPAAGEHAGVAVGG